MNLKKQLKQMDKNQIVAIATENGHSFLYIGKAGDQELIKKVFQKYDDYIEKYYAMYCENLKTLIFEETPMLKDCDEERNMDILCNYAASISMTLKNILKYKKYLGIHLFNRRVKEMYHKDVDDATAIIVDGCENGEFWFKKEFDKKYGIEEDAE